MSVENSTWTHNITSKGDYWAWKCDKCGNRSLEQFKICLGCLKGKRPPIDKSTGKEKRLTNNAPAMNINGFQRKK